MHVISRKALETFWLKHPGAKTPLETWYKLVNAANFESFNAIKHIFNTADYVPPYTVFDIGGNNFRVICVIHFNRQKLYVREVFTHSAYDRWSKALRSKKQ